MQAGSKYLQTELVGAIPNCILDGVMDGMSDSSVFLVLVAGCSGTKAEMPA